MSLRVSQIILQVVTLDEYDAPRSAEPLTFVGDADGPADAKALEWLNGLPDHLKNAMNGDGG